MIIRAIILNFKNKTKTITCVNSLKASILPSEVQLKLLVVDNASADGIERALATDHTDVEFFQTGANLGYTGGNNAGIREVLKKYIDDPAQINNDYMLIINNDTYVDPFMIAELIAGIKRHPQAGLVSPKIYFTPNSRPAKILDKSRVPVAAINKEAQTDVIWYAGGTMDWNHIVGSHTGVDEVDEGQYDYDSRVDYASGCCFLMPLDLAQKLHGFDDKYFMYYEDVDLNMRIKKAGYDIWYISKAKVWHENASGSSVGSALQVYFSTRNRLLFGIQYASWRTKIALLRQTLSYRQDPIRAKAAKDFFTLQFGKGTFQI